MAFQEVIQVLVDVGLIDVILPFLLVFIITYSLLQKTQVFGEDQGRINAMIAFVVGFLAVLATNLLDIINVLLSWFVLVLVTGLMLAMVFGLVGAETGNRNKVLRSIMLIVFPLFLIYGLARAGLISQGRFFTLIALPVLIIGMAIIAMYFVFEKKEKKPKRGEGGGLVPGSPLSPQGSQSV